MTDVVAVDGSRFEKMERVAELTTEGYNPTQIAKTLGIGRKIVMELQADWRLALQNDADARDLAREHLHQLNQNYDKLIVRLHKLNEDLDMLDFDTKVAQQRRQTIVSIAELDAKRLDFMQKAGLLDGAELGNELAEMEEQQNMLIEILRNDLCPACKANVAHKLSRVTGDVEAQAEGEVVRITDAE